VRPKQAPASRPTEGLGRKTQGNLVQITYRKFIETWEHTVGLVLGLLSVWVVHFVLGKLFGPDEKFFDYLPLRYIIDLAEIVVLGKFLWHLIRGFTKDEK
jgi:hypothetical protein